MREIEDKFDKLMKIAKSAIAENSEVHTDFIDKVQAAQLIIKTDCKFEQEQKFLKMRILMYKKAIEIGMKAVNSVAIGVSILSLLWDIMSKINNPDESGAYGLIGVLVALIVTYVVANVLLIRQSQKIEFLLNLFED